PLEGGPLRGFDQAQRLEQTCHLVFPSPAYLGPRSGFVPLAPLTPTPLPPQSRGEGDGFTTPAPTTTPPPSPPPPTPATPPAPAQHPTPPQTHPLPPPPPGRPPPGHPGPAVAPRRGNGPRPDGPVHLVWRHGRQVLRLGEQWRDGEERAALLRLAARPDDCVK